MTELLNKLNPTKELQVGDKTYKITVVKTDEEKEIGLSHTTELPEDLGMFFVYEEPQEELYFTSEDMRYPIDICFFDESGECTSVHHMKAFDEEYAYDEDVLFVLEVNVNSGIEVGDEIAEYSDEEEEDDTDEDFTDEDKKDIQTYGKMLLLDTDGNVQYKIDGGNRIVSRIETRKLIKKALKAFHSDSDIDYRAVGRFIFKVLDGQDSRQAEYVESPD